MTNEQAVALIRALRQEVLTLYEDRRVEVEIRALAEVVEYLLERDALSGNGEVQKIEEDEE